MEGAGVCLFGWLVGLGFSFCFFTFFYGRGEVGALLLRTFAK